jgi:hypothetical protein
MSVCRIEADQGTTSCCVISCCHFPCYLAPLVSTPADNRLFNAAAAEGFHVALCPDTTGLADETFTVVRKRLTEAMKNTEKTPRDWVMNRTADNRPGLKTRYPGLAAKADQEAVRDLLTTIDTWAKWLVLARNAMAHLDTGEFEARVPEEARYRLTRLSLIGPTRP